MKRTLLLMLLLVVGLMTLAAPALAADGANEFDVKVMALLAAGGAIGIAAGLCGLGQGRATAAAAEGTARNPGAGDQIFKLTIVGLALIESLTIYALAVSLLLVFTKG